MIRHCKEAYKGIRSSDMILEGRRRREYKLNPPLLLLTFVNSNFNMTELLLKKQFILSMYIDWRFGFIYI